MRPVKRVRCDDPAWSRSTSSKKKQKMCSRASLRLLSTLMRKKQIVDKKKARAACVTRTVEFAATQNIGDERSKLLFMLALGLMPKSNVRKDQFPRVVLEKLDPEVESDARARTRDVIFQIFQRRKQEALQRRIFHDMPAECVEIIDLVSTDEDSTCSDDESEMEPVIIEETYRSAMNINITTQRNLISRYPADSVSSCKIMHCQPRKSVFKQLGNSQDSLIFRNWKPESMTRLMNKETSESKSVEAFSRSETLLSSLKSLPITTKLTFNAYTSKLHSGAGRGASYGKPEQHEVASSASSSNGAEYIVPDTMITID